MQLQRIQSGTPAFRNPIRRRSAAGARFARNCAALPGARVLRDVALEEVTLSFGWRTENVASHLTARGYRVEFVEWGSNPVLRIPFGPTADEDVADELADALIIALGEIEVAETRLW